LVGVKSLQKLCDAKIIGDEIGSTNLKFWPGDLKSQTMEIESALQARSHCSCKDVNSVDVCKFAGKAESD
jgi:hypothetical protein